MVDDRPVFFAHIPRSGGTTVVQWVTSQLPFDQVYPRGTPESLLIQKMFPSELRELPSDAHATVRFYAPHLPASVHELVGTEVRLAALVRDPVGQLRSVLAMQEADPDADPDADADPLAAVDRLAMPWYVTHQLHWYLGADAGDVVGAYEAAAREGSGVMERRLDDAMAAVATRTDLVDRACSRLERIELLALTPDADRLAQRIAALLRIPGPAPGLRLNAGSRKAWPAGSDARICALLGAELDIYERAVALVASRGA